MIKFVRLDYRLLHGQVVFSWTGHVGAQRIIVVDDDAANDEMKKSALLLSKPAGVRVNIFTVDKTIAKMPKVEQLDEKIMMIFGNTAALLKFCQAYPKIKEINYGAVANKPGSKIKTISIANELAEAIYSVYTNQPVSTIFGGNLNL